MAEQLLKPGALIGGRYEVVRTLGHGGMGAVLQVVDRALEGEAVALKLLYPHLAQDKTSFARFRNEVLVARRLSHPNIVRLYDIGNAGGGYYFLSMEYVDGGNLTKHIYEHRNDLLSFKETLRILRDIAHGISHAHKNGVVHRDLKPDNILLAGGTEVKITDFGLARSLYVDKGFTDTGEAVGTPYYMAPEQLRGDKVDGRCDIYALGLIAFEMVVGRRPFFEESYLQLAALHFKEPIPDFATKESGIPKWYEDFVKNCSEKVPADRFQSAEEIADFLHDKLEALEGRQGKIRRRPAILSFYAHTQRKRVWKAGSVFALMIFCGAALGILGRTVSGNPKLLGPLLRVGSNFSSGIEARIDPAKYLVAIEQNDEYLFELLLAAGAPVNPVSATAKAPIFAAVEFRRIDFAIRLLEAKANPNMRDAVTGFTPLILAVKDPQAADLVDALLASGAQPDKQDDQQRTPLMYAAQAGNARAVDTLLRGKAMAGSADAFGKTALIYAIESGNPDAVASLARTTELRFKDKRGRTALFYAAELPGDGLTKKLVEAGADVEMTDADGNTAVSVASTANRKYLKSLKK